jgi:hypothetical protein
MVRAAGKLGDLRDHPLVQPEEEVHHLWIAPTAVLLLAQDLKRLGG